MPSNFYNAQYKQDFLSKISINSKDHYKMLFNASCDLEKSLGKDIVLFNDGDYINLFTNQDWVGNALILQKKSLIRKYIQWYIEQGLPDWEQIQDFYIDSVTQQYISQDKVYGREWFITPDDIAKLFAEYKKRNTDNSFYPEVEAITWLVFYGFTERDALNLPKSSINESDKTVLLRNKPLSVCKPAIDCLIDYKNARFCIVKSKHDSTKAYVQSDLLFRTHINPSIKPEAIRLIINKFNKRLSQLQLEKQIKLRNVYWSGIFHRAYEYEKLNGEIAAGDLDTIKILFQFDNDTNRNTYTNRLKDYRTFRRYRENKM